MRHWWHPAGLPRARVATRCSLLASVIVVGCGRGGFEFSQLVSSDGPQPSLIDQPDATEIFGSSPQVRLDTVVATTALGLAWADVGSASTGEPDGTPDLIVSSITDGLSVHLVAGTEFGNSAFEPLTVFAPLGYRPHGVSTTATLPSGRVEALGLASTSQNTALFRWSEPAADYVDLANDDVVEDNVLIAGDTSQQYSFQFALLDYDGDGDPDLYRIGGLDGVPRSNELLTNVGSAGSWLFERVGTAEDAAADGGTEARGLVVSDLDSDGRPDLFVASLETTLHINGTTATDTPVFRILTGTGDASFPFSNPGELMHGVAAFDYDNDADLDLYLLPWNFGAARLYRNESLPGVPSFDWIAAPTLQLLDVGFKTTAFPGDYDNDGDLDLYVTAASDATTSFPNTLLRNDFINERGEVSSAPPFVDLTPDSLRFAVGSCYNASWVDHDRDGDLDLFVAIHGGAGSGGGLYLVRNNYYESGGTLRYYRVRLRRSGRANPTGTRVVVHYGEHRQIQEITPTLGFGSAPYPDLHFGVGPHETVDVEVFQQGDPVGAPSLSLEDVPTSNTPNYLHEIDL